MKSILVSTVFLIASLCFANPALKKIEPNPIPFPEGGYVYGAETDDDIPTTLGSTTRLKGFSYDLPAHFDYVFKGAVLSVFSSGYALGVSAYKGSFPPENEQGQALRIPRLGPGPGLEYEQFKNATGYLKVLGYRFGFATDSMALVLHLENDTLLVYDSYFSLPAKDWKFGEPYGATVFEVTGKRSYKNVDSKGHFISSQFYPWTPIQSGDPK